MEVWKPVKSKPGVMASSYGRIMLPAREAEMPNGGKRIYETKPTWGCETRGSKNASHVYMALWSRHYGNLKIHQLVCEAFHGPRPFPSAVVIHIDENARNNKSENLKWGTQKENLNAPGFIEYCKNRSVA